MPPKVKRARRAFEIQEAVAFAGCTGDIDAEMIADVATGVDDENSCPPTELDSDSDDANATIVNDDVAAVANNATMCDDANVAIRVDGDDAAINANESVVLSSGDKQEENRCNYMHIANKLEFGSVPYLKMVLTPSGGDDSDHSVRYVQKMLERGYVKGFKIGATHLLVQRWKRYREEIMHRWREMAIDAVTESLDEIKRLEKSVISAFRRYDTRGILVNGVSGHPLCLNRLPGGESLDHGHSPFFLYIVRK